mgnify:FL=1
MATIRNALPSKIARLPLLFVWLLLSIYVKVLYYSLSHNRRLSGTQLSTVQPTYVNRRAHIRGLKNIKGSTTIFSVSVVNYIREQIRI